MHIFLVPIVSIFSTKYIIIFSKIYTYFTENDYKILFKAQ